MNLRTPGDSPAERRPRRSGLRLLAPCALLAVGLLTFFAGSSGAGVAEYAGTLYLDGPASGKSGTSFQILASAGPSAPAAPTVVAGVSGSGTIASASYQYVYIARSGSSETASAASAAVVIPANGSATVTGPPVGSDVYRGKVTAGVLLGTYVLVSPPGGTTSAPFVDTGANSGASLPQADNRPMTGTTGWTEFTPGVGLALTTSFSTMYGSAPSLPSTCKGWVVDGPGNVSFPAGNWTFQVRVKPGATAAGNGSAALTAAMWKIDDSGNTIGSSFLISPTDGSTITSTTGTAMNATATGNPGAFTLGSGEHLCVQFWRHQTLAYTSGTTTHTISLLGWDANNQITVHPVPNGFAWATPASPADGAHTQTVPALGATYTDGEADPGTVKIRLCSDTSCASVLQTSAALAATNGSTQTWTPTGALADGTYYWQAQGQDGTGLPSAWSAARSFVVDTVPPSTSITSNPPALSNASGASFAFAANESVTGYQCKLDGGAFAGCASPYTSSGLADGSHTFQVKATADLAGNAGSATSYSWTIDTAPPDTTLTSSPSALSNTASPTFSFSSTEPGSSFQCNLDGAGFSGCANPQSYSGLADGAHTFQVRAVDAAGNADPTPGSYSWTIDSTPPDTSIGPSQPAALTTSTGATFDFSTTEPGSTFECSRDGASFTACTTPKSYSGLADGSHTFQVRSSDAAGNTDPSPASYTWVVDTTPPDTSIGPTQPAAHTPLTGATFDLAATELGSTFQCSLDGGAYAACSTPATYSGLGDGTHSFSVKATDPAGNTDPSAATYSWHVDTVAPATPAQSSPADALLTNAMPQLKAVFSDATPGDSGTIDLRICSTSAPAGTACAPLVASATSGSLASGGTATLTPAPLPDGTYHWQVRAQDLTGNQSGWSATRSFQIDSSAPTVPALLDPVDGAWLRAATLQATFSKPAFAGTGTIEFRVCSDGACLATASSGTSPTLINGATAAWALPERLGDGMYWWQARAHDAAGNVSAWSAPRTFHLDKTPPATPKNFSGQVAEDGLTLRWDPPADDSLGNFFIYVNGVSTESLGATTYEYKVGPFDAGDPREFAIVAVDRAGNQSPMSKTLVGVPNVVGLTLGQAEDAAKARGLVVHRASSIQQAGSGVVTAQNPPAGSVAPKGTTVSVVVDTSSAPTALTMSASPARVTCGAGAVVRLQLRLSEAATVRARLLSGRRTLETVRLGHLEAGTSNVRVKLPRRLAPGSYGLQLDATAGGSTTHTAVAVKAGSRRSCTSR